MLEKRIVLRRNDATDGDDNIAGTSPNLALTTTTGAYAAAFTDVSGADGTKSTAYALTLNSTASGLVDSHTQTADVLVQVNATTIESVMRTFRLSPGQRNFLLGARRGEGLFATKSWIAMEVVASPREAEVANTTIDFYTPPAIAAPSST